MNVRAYLVDDEPLALERLARLLGRMPGVEVVGSTTEPEEAVLAMTHRPPDVCFLDIHMPRLTGFDVLARLPDPPIVIFTTAYDEYALQAFEVSAVDYLLKPVNPKQLERALGKLGRLRGTEGPPRQDVGALLENLAEVLRQKPAAYADRIASRLGERLSFLDVSEVTHFVAEDKLTYAVAGGKRYCVDHTIVQLESRVDPRKFFRVHRRALVSLAWVAEAFALPGGGLSIRLKDAARTELTVARDRARELKSRLGG